MGYDGLVGIPNSTERRTMGLDGIQLLPEVLVVGRFAALGEQGEGEEQRGVAYHDSVLTQSPLLAECLPSLLHSSAASHPGSQSPPSSTGQSCRKRSLSLGGLMTK
jgi:hypothetical protein